MAVSAGTSMTTTAAAAFYDLYIAVRKDIYIDDGVIIDAVPKIRNKFFGGGERHTEKLLSAFSTTPSRI